MKYWQTQHFKAMQQAWYAKLKTDGFVDAEEMIAGEMLLKQSATHPYRGLDCLSIGYKEDYFRFMSQRAQDNEFQSEVDRTIVTMFAEGSKIKSIVQTLHSEGKPRCRGTVRFTIRKYEMEWGLKDYSPKQLNKRVQRTA